MTPRLVSSRSLASRTLRLLALLTVFGVPFLHAELVWEATSLELVPEPGAESIAGSFAFVNEGDMPVEVLRVKTSCGCTVASLEKRLYAPGESGSIQAQLDTEGKVGKVAQKIYAFTKSGGEPKTYKLQIAADIPEYVRYQERLLLWKEGDEPATRTVDFEVVHDQPIRLVSAESSNPLFKTALTTIEDGRRYRLAVTPTEIKPRTWAKILLTADFPEQRPLTYTVHTRINPKIVPPKVGFWDKLFNKIVRLIP